jgi:protein ImuB
VRNGVPCWQGALDLEGERERIENAWWVAGGVARDYFVARAGTGERLWIYRDLRSNGWFLHGFFG